MVRRLRRLDQAERRGERHSSAWHAVACGSRRRPCLRRRPRDLHLYETRRQGRRSWVGVDLRASENRGPLADHVLGLVRALTAALPATAVLLPVADSAAGAQRTLGLPESRRAGRAEA